MRIMNMKQNLAQLNLLSSPTLVLALALRFALPLTISLALSLSLSFTFVLTIVGCSGTTGASSLDETDSSSNISESAMAEAGHQATVTEGATAPSLLSLNLNSQGSQELQESQEAIQSTAAESADAANVQTFDFLNPQDSVHAKTACTFSAARGTCSNNLSIINWNSCTVGNARLSGGWTETWSPGFCANGALPTALTNGASVTRTSTGQVLTMHSGAYFTTSTLAHTAYDGTLIPNTGVHVSMTGGTRTLTIDGIHRVLVGHHNKTLFDHTLTSSGLSVSGSRANGNRVVSGTMTMFHNLALFKMTHTFNNVTWGSASCCYPTSGSITSALTGSRTGTTTMTFSSSCGAATFTDNDTIQTDVALSQCE